MDSLPSWARVGQKVVCVIPMVEKDVSWEPIKPIAEETVLTIRKVWTNGAIWGFYFREVRNPVTQTSEGYLERGYPIQHFKPLISKTIEDDLAIFAPLLNTKKEEELV
jgi:hypothetical protein